MKKSVIVLSVLSILAVSSAHANRGKVTFTGSIIDAPCSIAPGSLDQTVSLGAISNVVLAENGNTGSSTPQRFTIELEDCVVATPGTKDKVTTRFTGATSSYDPESLALTGGTAGGASIQLFANNGEKVKINTPTSEQHVFDGNNTLTFTANVKGGGSTATIIPGTFQVPANFVLSYN